MSFNGVIKWWNHKRQLSHFEVCEISIKKHSHVKIIPQKAAEIRWWLSWKVVKVYTMANSVHD